jgi:hypothetical protein
MEIIMIFGKEHEVIKRYELTDEYMREHELLYKKRITVKCLETGIISDFANTCNL